MLHSHYRLRQQPFLFPCSRPPLASQSCLPVRVYMFSSLDWVMNHELDCMSFFVTLEKRLPLSRPVFLSVKMKQQNTSRGLPALRFYVWITLTPSCSRSVIYPTSNCSEPAVGQVSARSRDAGSDNKMRTPPTGSSWSTGSSLSCECREGASEEP